MTKPYRLQGFAVFTFPVPRSARKFQTRLWRCGTGTSTGRTAGANFPRRGEFTACKPLARRPLMISALMYAQLFQRGIEILLVARNLPCVPRCRQRLPPAPTRPYSAQRDAAFFVTLVKQTSVRIHAVAQREVHHVDGDLLRFLKELFRTGFICAVLSSTSAASVNSQEPSMSWPNETLARQRLHFYR